MDGALALIQLGGVATRAEWRKLVSPAEARAALSEGRVVRLNRWQVAVPDLDEAVRAAAALGGTVSHLSAAIRHGWKVKRPPLRPVVTLPRHRKPPSDAPEADVFYADLSDSDKRDGATGPVRTVIDCARSYERDVALCVADSALRSALVTRSQLLDAAQASPRTGRAKAIWVADHATDLAANPFESVLRDIALDVPGLDVRPQGWIGRAGRADLVDEHLLVAIEADSWEHHGAPELFRRDVRRYTEFARLGWVVVRFVWEDVMQKPDLVRRHLTDVAAVRARQLLDHRRLG
jgi:very-short-patch-repair endonuclease